MSRTHRIRVMCPYLLGAGLGLITANLWAQEYFFAAVMATGTVGLSLNVTVLATNGWRMPVRKGEIDTLDHVTLTPTHRFSFLGDVLAFGKIRVSVGDVLMALAVVLAWGNLIVMGFSG